MEMLSEYLYIFSSIIIIVLSIVLFRSQNKKVEKEVAIPEPQMSSEPEVFIYYGSQTGTAAKFCEQLKEEAAQQNINAQVVDLQDYSQHLTEQQKCIFLTATHGEGEPTDNAKDFYKFIKEKQDKNEKYLLNFAVFGLGNTQYKHYNAMGKFFNQNLESLGGSRWYQYGEGDDGSTMEIDFENWKQDLWKTFKETQNFEVKQPRKVSIQNVEYEFHTKNYLQGKDAQIVEIKELKQNPEMGSCLEVILEGVQYETAQNLAFYPQNSDLKTQQVCEFLEIDGDEQVTWQNNKLPFPLPISKFQAIKQYCDIQGILKKKTLKDLSKKCSKQEDREKLENLGSIKGKNDYDNQILAKKITILDIIKQYNIKLTFQEFVELSGRIAPRFFTISSSDKYSKQLRLTASIEAEKVDNSQFYGLASQNFVNMKNELPFKVKVGIRESGFKLPKQSQAKIVMIGAGAGIAPFIGFLEENEYLKQTNQQTYEMVMYFGCRQENGDYLYKQRLSQFKEQNLLNDIKCAFSRDQSRKIYVQDIIFQDQDNIFNLYEQGAYFYICGSLSMGKSVIETISQIIQQKTNESQEQMKKRINELEKNQRLIKELWG